MAATLAASPVVGGFRDTDAPEHVDLAALLLPEGSLPRQSFSMSYSMVALDGWVKQRSPSCGAASVGGAWNALMGLRRTDPGALNALVQAEDGALRAMLIRFQVDLRAAVPAGALDAHSLQIASLLDPHADPHAAIDQRSDASSLSARTTQELRRLAKDLPEVASFD